MSDRFEARLGGMVAVAVVALMLPSAPSQAFVVDPFYAGSYTATSLGNPLGVPANLGGLTLKAGDNNTLLIGGAANASNGAIYSIGVTRDGSNHITGFSGSATLFASAPQIDGGLAYGPGGVLFFTGYPTNAIGQVKTGSVAPDRTDDAGTLPGGPVASSVGSLQFVPVGISSTGNMKIVSYNGGGWYDATTTSDGFGTYNITINGAPIAIGGGPEGIAFVEGGNALFPVDSVLISEYSAGKVESMELDANGNPILGTRKNFVTGLGGAEGAFVDPLTGDFLFSTFGGGNQIVAVRGFTAPPTETPEPMSLALLGLGLAGLGLARRRS